MPHINPRVGIGVIIVNGEGKVLLGKRPANDYAPFFAIPGGHLELGETFEACAIREAKEETHLDIRNPRVVAITNNLETYRSIGKHYISVILLAEAYTGELQNCEPDKCEGWGWYDPDQLPEPLYEPSRVGIACWQRGVYYLPT